ncbi:MAG: hypothetical protein HZA60_00100, partial [Deltaproteobacteria bacterium]|nr:hypothetical protein [Deltaproteobacteria bacterium]
MEKRPFLRSSPGSIVFGAAVVAGLYLASLQSYLLFHSLAEIFSIVVACSVFMVAWNARRSLDNAYFLFIGITYLFVGAVDILHMLSYKGMGVFQGQDANLPTQLWIAGRYLQGASLLIAPRFAGRNLNHRAVLACYSGIVALLLGSIFWRVFPDCFVEGAGLTPFKIYSEYAVSALLLASIPFLMAGRKFFDEDVLRLLVLSAA